MSKTFQIWSLLSAIHLGLATLSNLLGIDRLSAIVAGTIYLPLWPIGKLGIPVFQHNQSVIPPPNVLGWVLVLVIWSLVYLAIAHFLDRILKRHPPAA